VSIFEHIKARVSIQDVIGEYTALKPAGTYLKGRCPFHHERTASFTVSPHRDIFYCFGCHAGGDVIAFMAKAENCSQLEAAHLLAERYSIALPEESALQGKEAVGNKRQHRTACSAVAAWCHEKLHNSAVAKNYLGKRGFNEVAIKDYCLGYFPGGPKSLGELRRAISASSLLQSDLVDAGILVEGHSGFYSPFEERIIFPIRDQLGQCCGFGGRIFKPDDIRSKYYNSRESDHFAKGSLLFGMDRAKQVIQQEGTAFLVEGYTDCIAMAQHGFGNCVATLGTACTVKHLGVLARYAREVYTLYDGDAAGEQAILRLATLCWQSDLELRVIEMSAGQDPASFLQAGGDLCARVAQAKEISVFFIDTMGNDFGAQVLGEKVVRTRRLLEVIAAVGDPLKQDILLQRAAGSMGVSTEVLRRELRRVRPPAGAKDALFCADVGRVASVVSREEDQLKKRLFCGILDNVGLLEEGRIHYMLQTLPEPMREILARFWRFRQENKDAAFRPFLDSMGSDERAYVSRLLAECGDVSRDECERLMAQLCRKQWKSAVGSMKAELAAAGTDQGRVQEILKKYLTLRQDVAARCAMPVAEDDHGRGEKKEHG